MQYSRQFTQPMTQVASMANLLQSGVASAERVFEFLDAPEQVPDPADGPKINGTRGRIEFEHVWFSYSPNKPLLEDLSLVAEPGRHGRDRRPDRRRQDHAGQPHHAVLRARRGRITLDGRDITEMSRQELRDEIGMVLQDAWLFKGTIRENIAYGRPGASEAEVIEAATATYVDQFVAHLPTATTRSSTMRAARSPLARNSS